MISTKAQSGAVAFAPRARLLKLIGRELIANEIVALTELVKNAHDADSSRVTIEFKDVADGDGEIVIRDDGEGMDLDTLLNCWMQPAGSSKSQADKQRTASGRRVLGEKGVGRFAADKLGSELELISRTAGSDKEIRAVFDWDLFDSDTALLSEITSRWEVRAPTEIETHGTVLKIRNLRNGWSERRFRRLCSRLSRLRTPFNDRDAFQIVIDSDDFPEYAGEVGLDLLESSPYQIEAAFDGEETIRTTFNNGETAEHLWNGAGELRCGPVKVRLFGFDLETEALAKLGPRVEVRAWLKEWAGVSVYRDSYRIWPYGEPHDDWLRLDQRRVNNPVVRLSNNQVLGFVEISRDDNPDLVDQTNRQGLIHNRALEDLRRFLGFVLQILEAERQTIRRPQKKRRNSPGTRVGSSSAAQEDSLSGLKKLGTELSPILGPQFGKAISRVEEHIARDRLEFQRLEEGFADLAALGQAAMGLAVSTRPLIEQLREEIKAIRTEVKGAGLKRSVSSLEETLEMVDCRLAMVDAMEQGGGKRRRTIDIVAEMDRSVELFGPLLDRLSVEVDLEWPDDAVLRTEMRPEVFHRLVHILLSNSLDWLHGVKKPRMRVKVRQEDDDHVELVFSDNGPGIPKQYSEQIFEPLFSGKENGHGMGLTIARSLVGMHGGQIEVLSDGRRKGANIRVLLPRKKPRATRKKRK